MLIEQGFEYVAAHGEPLACSDVAFLGQAPVGVEVDQAPVVGMRLVGEEGDEGSPVERVPGVFIRGFAAETGDNEEVDGVVCSARGHDQYRVVEYTGMEAAGGGTSLLCG